MQSKRDNKQTRMMLLPPIEELIPEDDRLRRLNKVLDLSFIHDAVREYYCQDNGRPSVDPEVIIRLFLLQAIEGIVHVRELMRRVQLDLAYRWFIGYELDEKLPDHSTLSKALDRFGDEIFDELFERSVAQCKQSGLIEGRLLHVDATTIRADLDVRKVDKPDSSDKDARFGRFGDGSKKPGYKQQTVVDDRSRVVLDVDVTPANGADEKALLKMVDRANERLDRKAEAVCADGGYSSGRNQAELESRGIILASPPQPEPSGDGYYAIGEFDYDESLDQFICPAGEVLRYGGGVSGRPGKRRYRASPGVCADCRLKRRCTRAPQRQLSVGRNHGALQRLRAFSKTDDFRCLYRRRAPVIEGVFAEAKQWHGLRRAWRRGLSKMRIQCLLIAAVINFKRLVSVLDPSKALFWIYYCRLVQFFLTIVDFIKQRRCYA
jgi:transposase